MRRFAWSTITLSVILLMAGAALAEDEKGSTVTVKLTNPSEPCLVECGLVNGGITVIAYEGEDVIVEATPRLKPITESGSGGGLKRIPVASSTLEVEEHNNQVEINTDSWRRPIDVSVKVPVRTSLQLSCVNSGDILVEGVSGDVEVENVNGAVTIKKVSGSVVAYAHNKDIIVDLKQIMGNKPMSFVSWNGDVDVTLPANLKATVKVKAGHGEAYSDFDIQKSNKPRRVIEENGRGKDGKYRVRIEESFYGEINGGGPEFQFSTYNGSIYIRKGK